MYDHSKVQAADLCSFDQHFNQRTSWASYKSSEEPHRDANVLPPTQSAGDLFGFEFNLHSSCYLRLHISIDGQKEYSSTQCDFAAEKVGRMNEHVQSLHYLYECDLRDISTDVHPSKCLPRSGPPEMGSTSVSNTSNLDDYCHFDIALSDGSSSDFGTFSSFDSAGLEGQDAIHTPPSEWGVESQTVVLGGVGQWIDDLQDSSWTSCQISSLPMDDAEDPKLDLAKLHALATTKPFGQYLHMRKDEEGLLDFEMYSLLP